MEERNPAKHPAILAGISLLGVAAGVVVGFVTHPYGSFAGLNAFAGGVFGLFFGIFLAVIWSLIATFFD